jgi:hypothetical protein
MLVQDPSQADHPSQRGHPKAGRRVVMIVAGMMANNIVTVDLTVSVVVGQAKDVAETIIQRVAVNNGILLILLRE